MDQLRLYQQLVRDTMLKPGATSAGDSVVIDGITCAMVRQGRVILNFGVTRALELIDRKLGGSHEEPTDRWWLRVDPGVDKRIFRELFREATSDENVVRAAVDDFMYAVLPDILALPELSDPDWDTYSMVAEVTDSSVKMTAYRYTESGPPVPTEEPVNSYPFIVLRNNTRRVNGAWDVALVKVRRGAEGLTLHLLHGQSADSWRVSPRNMDHLSESLRWLPGERPPPSKDKTAVIHEYSQAIAGDILTLPELSDPDWDTYSMAAEVSENMCKLIAFRYTESGPPVSTDPLQNEDLLWDLQDKTRGTNGEAWDVVLVKIHRDTAQLVLNFVRGESADMWRIIPENMDHLPESLRPRPEDFQPIDETEDIVERFQALLEAERAVEPVDAPPQPTLSEILQPPVHVNKNEDCNGVIGDWMNTKQSAAAWPEVSGDRHAVWAGRAVNGAIGLLLEVHGSNPETRVINSKAIGLVRLSDVTRRPDGGFQARVESVPTGPTGDLHGVVHWAELRDLLRRAADRDPAFVTGWERRPAMRPPREVGPLKFHDVAEDLLRRLPMPLSIRTELQTRPERDRFQTLIDQLREIAEGTPPEPETAQRLDRPLVDLPSHPIPALGNVWLTPGNVSTILASDHLCNTALATGWLAFTTKPITVGRAAMVTRPLRRTDTANADGWYSLTTDQIRPAIIAAVLPGEQNLALVELAPAPSAAEYAGGGQPEPREAQERLSGYLQLLNQAYARNTHVVGTMTGASYRLWQAGRFTSLRALMSWQIGQLGFKTQAVFDLQAITWPERLRALTLLLQGVAAGRPLAEMTAEAAEIAASQIGASQSAADQIASSQPAAVHDDSSAAVAELSEAIASEILTHPDLTNTDWDTYAMVAEVNDYSVKMSAYRYTESGPPVPTEALPQNMYVFIQVRDRTRGTTGEAWDIAIVKIRRETGQVVLRFVSGAESEMWRVKPAHLQSLPGMLRPRPEDFGTA